MRPSPPQLVSLFAIAAFTTLAGGCCVIGVAGKAATTTIGVAADVTAAAVRGTGKIAAAAVGASGDVADEGVRVAGKLSKSGMVVFFDPQTGATWEVPWREGLNLVAAAELAKLDSALAAARIIRDGKAIATREAEAIAVKSGDVVELTRKMEKATAR